MHEFRWSHAFGAALLGLLVGAIAGQRAGACGLMTSDVSATYSFERVRAGMFASERAEQEEADAWPATARWNLAEERLVLADGTVLETR